MCVCLSQAPSEGVVQVTLVRGKRKAGALSYAADPRERQDGRWPAGNDVKFCRFVLQKENMDTQAALGLLARMLHCKPSAPGRKEGAMMLPSRSPPQPAALSVSLLWTPCLDSVVWYLSAPSTNRRRGPGGWRLQA